jgi:hypothetical protein
LAISAPRLNNIERLRHTQATDPVLAAIRDEITVGTNTSSWSLIDGMVALDSCL